VVDFLAAISSRPIVSRGIEVEADDEFQEYKELGFGLCYESGVLHQVALHSGLGDSSYARYERELIHGVVFGYSEDDVRQEMGSPVFEGGGNSGFFGKVLRWIKYKRGSHTIHFEFGEMGKGLQTVTLGLV